jgi:hypothetical protein
VLALVKTNVSPCVSEKSVSWCGLSGGQNFKCIFFETSRIAFPMEVGEQIHKDMCK